MASARKPKGRLTCRIKYRDQHGRVQERRTRIRDKGVARALALKVEADAQRIRAGQLPLHPDVTGPYLGLATPAPARPFADALDSYLNELARQGSGPDSDHHRDSRTLLKAIARHCGWKLLADVRPDQFTEFLGRLAAKGRAPRTQNRYFETLRAFLNYCVRQTWLEKSPLDRLKPVKVGQAGRRRLRRAYTLSELDRLCAAARWAVTQVCYRVAAFSGFRKRELRKLRKEDCTPVGDRPRWHTGPHVTKNKQPVRLPMTAECAATLRAHWERLPPGAPLLAVPRKETFLGHLERAGIPRVDERGRHADFHSLRYTFCWLLAQKFPIEVVSKFMRHGSINLTSQIYLDLGLDRTGEGEWVLPPLLPDKPPAKPQGPALGPTA